MKSTLIHLSVAAFANLVSVNYAQAKPDKCIQIQVASVARRDVVAAGQSDFIINSSTDDQARISDFDASQTHHDFAIYADEKEPIRAQALALTQGGFVFIVVPKTANFDNDQAFGLTDRPIRFCSEL